MSFTEFSQSDGNEFVGSEGLERGNRQGGIYMTTIVCSGFTPNDDMNVAVEILNSMRSFLRWLPLPLKQGQLLYTYDQQTNTVQRYREPRVAPNGFFPGQVSLVPPAVFGLTFQVGCAPNECVYAGRISAGPVFSALVLCRKKIKWRMTQKQPNLMPLRPQLRPVCVFDAYNIRDFNLANFTSRSAGPFCYEPGEGGVINEPPNAVTGRMLPRSEIDFMPPPAVVYADPGLFVDRTEFVLRRIMATKPVFPGEFDATAQGVAPCCDL